jgi:hypothetical protein
MANCIAKASASYPGRSTSQISRQGSISALGEANTWRTFTRAYVTKDGSGNVSVIRDGAVIHSFDFPAEE